LLNSVPLGEGVTVMGHAGQVVMDKMLMHIAFDISHRMPRRTYRFKYNGVRFKLVQMNRRLANVLLTFANDEPEMTRAYAAGGEFLSALCWATNSQVAVWDSPTPFVPKGMRLRGAPVLMREPHMIARRGTGIMLGGHPCRIADVRTDAQRIALTLWREAVGANKVYLSFQFYWNILEVGRRPATSDQEAKSWVSTVAASVNDLRVTPREAEYLQLGTNDLGRHLYDHCRNPIAHITRPQGRTMLQFDSYEETRRLGAATGIVSRLARYYIRHELNVSTFRVLARKDGRGFPTFVPEVKVDSGAYTAAYP
jgi:hypothetical protein